MATAEPRILLLDPDREHQKRAAEAFNKNGFHLRYLADPAKLILGCKQLQPVLVLINAELRSPLVQAALNALSNEAAWSTLPVAVICDDVSEALFVEQLRTGVVELMPKLAPLEALAQRTHALLRELPNRSGNVQGRGDSPMLANLAEHLRRTLRSGVVTFNSGLPDQGRALFVKGKLTNADHKGVTGIEALLGMVTQSHASWSFSELSGGVGEGDAVVLELDANADEPLVPIIESSGESDGVLVPIEGADGADADEALIVGEPIEEEAAPPPAPAPAPPQKPVSILLVDDDEELCRMFGLLFRKHGYEVTTANDGVEGFEEAQKQKFDLVVADLNMPRMDGWGLLRLLRDDFRTRELPVAFLSCHDDYRDSLKALNAGAQAYYSKSTRLDALAGHVKGLLEPRRKFQAALAQSKPGDAIPVTLNSVGPQWLLRELAKQGEAFRIDAADGWAKYNVYVKGGRAIHAVAVAGRHRAEAEKAFTAFIASKATDAVVHRVDDARATTLQHGLEEELQLTAEALNENERRLRDGLMISANNIQVDTDLYAVYAQVGPKQWLETARLICEEKLPPKEVIARVDASPLDVEDTLKDLLRRGIVRLTA